ncbi:MAG: hypothetical protein ACNA7W_19480 [Pseudomonadales bacterium]
MANANKPPPGVAKFDSASAHVVALARFLQGRDFAGLGQSRVLQAATRLADWVPRSLRGQIFATLGANEGVPRDSVGKVSMERVAQWAAGLYPQRHYPALMIGSSNGALVHVAAALGIPMLPQTFLTLIKQSHVHPDDPAHAMEAERETSERFLCANPYSQLHHLHDPNQDRLMLSLITYFRSKYLRLPPAYRRLINASLLPNGTIYIVECGRTWPTTRVRDRHVFQFGAEGGATLEEYFHGGERVEAYLKRYQSPFERWNPPATDAESPEAEWGFEPALREEILELARDRGHRVVRIIFEDPEDPSGLVADFYRDWYRRRGVQANRLAIESFILMDPWVVLRTGSVPLWMTFNTEPSLAMAQKYLDASDPFDQIYLMLFAHGIDSVGLPPIEQWQSLVARAREQGELLGLDPSTYPAHFAHFARYSQRLRQRAAARYPLPEPLPLARFERFVDDNGARYGVRLEYA